MARVDYLDEAPQGIARAVTQAYVRGLEYSHGEIVIRCYSLDIKVSRALTEFRDIIVMRYISNQYGVINEEWKIKLKCM